MEHNPTEEDRRAPNLQLVQAVVHSHAWLNLLSRGTYASIDALARATHLHPKIICNRLRLAFLAPDLTKVFFMGISWHRQM